MRADCLYWGSWSSQLTLCGWFKFKTEIKPSQEGRSLPAIQVLMINVLNEYSRVNKSMGFGEILSLGLTCFLYGT